MIRVLKRGLFTFLLIALIIGGVLWASPNTKKAAQIRALDKIGDVAVKRMSSDPRTQGSVAAEFINIPIEAREIAPGIFQATGVGNAHLITTSEGNVLFDTGLVTQVPKQIKALEPHLDGQKLTHIILSHSHADHAGGTKYWQDDNTEIVAHEEFKEEQRYLSDLQEYQWGRNRTLFPFMPETPPKIGLLAYGGIEPTIKVRNGTPYKFTQGGIDFEVHALPGAEGADNVVLWLPKKKILFAGDFFGPLFPQFPNVFTMRGEKVRKPHEYIQSLEKIMELDPVMIVPSHRNPVTEKAAIDDGLRRMHGATKYVHDAVIAGMNGGKSVEDLMVEIQLPAELSLTQEHGKVSWAVKSIWEYYMTWFHFDKTTELYHVSRESVNADLLELAGVDALIGRARSYMDGGKPLEALHLLDVIGDTSIEEALILHEAALEMLKSNAENTTQNAYEIYWLDYKLREVRAKLGD